MAVIKEYVFALVFVVIAASVQSAKEEDYPEVDLPGIVIPEGLLNKVRSDPPVCLPDKWQANITGQTAMSGGRGRDKLTVIKNLAIYFDKTGKQIAGKSDEGGRHRNESGGFVMKFGDAKADLYFFSFAGQKCFHKEIKNATFKPQCLPANSTVQDVTLGPADGGLKAKAYSFRAQSPQNFAGMKVFACGVFIMANSLPVAFQDRGVIRRGRPHSGEDVITFDQDDDNEMDLDRPGPGPRGGVKFVSSFYYSSAKAAIDDPSVFTPPSYCNATLSAFPDSFLNDDPLSEILERFVSF